MKYTAAALGCLNARYRAVLKKCLLINLGFFALSVPLKATAEIIENTVAIEQDVSVSTADEYRNKGTITGNVTNNGSITSIGTITGDLTNNAGATIRDTNNRAIVNGNVENSGTVERINGIIFGNVTNKDGGKIKYVNQVYGNVTNQSGGIIENIYVEKGDLTNEAGGILNKGNIKVNGTLKNDGTIKNVFELRVGKYDNQNEEFINNGTAEWQRGEIFGNIVNNEDGVIDVTSNNTIYGGIDNKGTYTGALVIGGTDSVKNYVNNSGTIELVNAVADILRGTINNAEGATIKTKQEDTRFLMMDATLNNRGIIKNVDGTRLKVKNEKTGEITFGQGGFYGTIENKGQITMNGGMWDIENGGTIENDGTMVQKSGGGIMKGKGTLINKENATFENLSNNFIINVALENAGTVNNNGTILNTITNQSGGTLNNTGEIKGDIQNEGTINNLGTINTNEILNKKGATLTSDAEAIVVADNTITNDGTLDLTGGTNTNAITGEGTVTVSGDVTNNAAIDQNNVNIESGKSLANNNTITADVTNSGNLNNSGTINGTIKNDGHFRNGAGTINGDVINTGEFYELSKINGNLYNKAGGNISSHDSTVDGNLENEGYISADVTVTQNVTNKDGGQIWFIEKVNGNVVNEANGTINSMVVNGNLTNEVGGKLENGYITVEGNLINNGTMNKNHDNLVVGNRETKTGDFINNGIANFYSGTFNGNIINNNKIETTSSSNILGKVDNQGSILLNGGIWGISNEIKNSNKFTVQNGGFAGNGKFVNIKDGLLDIISTTGPNFRVALENAGTVNNNGTITGSSVTNSGTINNTGIIAAQTTNTGTINNEGNIYVAIDNKNDIINKAKGNISTTITNSKKVINQGKITRVDNLENGNVTNKIGGYIETLGENKGEATNAGNINIVGNNSGVITNESGGTINRIFNVDETGSVINQSGAIINELMSNNGTVINEVGGQILCINCNLTNNKTLKNAGNIEVKELKNMGTATNEENGIISAKQIINNKDAELTSSADKLITADKTITNAGTLTLTSGTNANRLVNTTTSEGEVIKGTLNIAGDVTNNATIEQKALNVNKQATLTNAENINVESVTNSGTINNDSGTLTTNELVNQEGAELITSAENIITTDNTIQNDGTLTLTGGTNANYITGTGSTTVTGNVTNNAEVTQRAVNIVQTGALTTSADSLHLTDSLANDGALTLTSGNNANDISGTGSTTVAGNVTNNAEVTQKAVNIAQTGALTTSADSLHLTDSLTNDGTLILTSGTNANYITGLGKIAILDNFDLGTGTISGNTVEVKSGTLKMSQNNNFDNTATLKVNQGATFDLNDRTATLKEAEFATGSAMKLNVNALDSHGTLNAEKIIVENGATLEATLAQGLVNYGETAEVKLLNAENKDFNNFNDKFDNNMYRFEKVGKNGAYTISLAKTAAEVAKETGASDTQANVAKAWVDGERFNNEKTQEVANKLADLAQNNQAEFVETLETIAPTQAPVVHDMTTDVNDRILQATVNHLKYGAAANMYGMSSGDEFNEVSVWGKTYLSQTDRESISNVQGFKVKSHGVVGGFDKKFSKNTKLGLGLQYDNADISSPNRKTDVDSLTGFIYGQYRPDNRFINWLASYGKADYDENKMALNQKFNAKYDAKTYALQGVTGYDFNFGDYRFTPEFGMRYYNIHRNAYTDGLGQRIKSQDMDILRAAAGISFAKDFCIGMCKITPEIYLGLTYDIIADNDKAVVMLDNGASYTVNGKRLNRLGYETIIGLTASLNDNIEMSLSYNGTYRKNYDNHMGLLNVKYKF